MRDLIIERATLQFEGLGLSPERAEAVSRRALQLLAEDHATHGLGAGRIASLELPAIEVSVSAHALDDAGLARTIATAVGDALRQAPSLAPSLDADGRSR